MVEVREELRRFKVGGVSERDIDLLLLEEFIASNAFAQWFIETATNDAFEVETCLLAHQSVTQANGESDLEVTLQLRDQSRVLLLIEDKINASLQPEQAERYLARAQQYREEGRAHRAISILVAPSAYFGDETALKGFDHRLTYEQLRDWFETAPYLGERRRYKASLLTAAIDKATLGWSLDVDAAATAFWHRYWAFVSEHAPEMNMKRPDGVPSGSTFLEHSPRGLPRGVHLIHKMRGHVDLELRGLGGHLGLVRQQLGDLIADDMRVEAAGKSAAIRLDVPRIAYGCDFETERDALDAAVLSAQRLLALAINAKATLDALLTSRPPVPTVPAALDGSAGQRSE